MKNRFTFLIIFFLPLCSLSQQLQQIPHCPSKEVYDLLIDKKGFVWIAHNLGVSRYDGISFTSFSNADQTSLSMTDLVEDNYGRIWCHNFNGQIFYIENDRMYCLKAYDFRGQTVFPRMILYHDSLVITSKNGLVICNTQNLKCSYVNINDPQMTSDQKNMGIIGVCSVADAILALAYSKDLYIFKKNQPLQKLKTTDLQLRRIITDDVKLEPRTLSDTFFLMDKTEKLLLGLRAVNNRLVTVFKKPVKDYLNSISILNNKVWINTITSSYTLDGKDTINSNNITSVGRDREGNLWLASINNGLLVYYKPRGWTTIQPPLLRGTDYVRCVKKINKGFILSSEYGNVIFSPNPAARNFLPLYNIPLQSGSTENIQYAFNNNFFIETSNSIYLLNAATFKVNLLTTAFTTKDITLNGDTAYLTSPFSLGIKNIREWGLTNEKKSSPFLINDSLLLRDSLNLTYLKTLHRSRAVLLDTITNSLLISFTDGLQRIKDNKISYVLYNNTPLYVSSMTKYKGKIYASTFNNGLFVIDKFNVVKITNSTEFSSENIFKIKLCNNHLWIFGTQKIEVLNVDNDQFVNDIYPYPADATDITDIEEDSGNIYMATIHGLYTIPSAENEETTRQDISLIHLLVNDSDANYNGNISLPANKNNLLFKFAIPVYQDAEHLHFKYRLENNETNDNEKWYYTQDGQRDIQFNAIKPGNYTLQLIAIKNNIAISKNKSTYYFTIQQPWYNTWWLYTLAIIALGTFFYSLYRYRLRQVIKIERIRRKISSDLHDDIGSTLSSINVYSQLAKTENDNKEYIDTIQTNTVSIINNLDDLVWNINPKNDILEYLLSRIELFALPLLTERDIKCFFKVKTDNIQIVIAPNLRANIYLLIKEIINNVLKHSECGVCSICFIQKGKKLRLIVKDNGKGFNTNIINRHRNGLHNMQERTKDIKGSITIKSSPGNGTEIRVDCRL